MTTADLIAREVQQLPETLAGEVLDFVRFLRWQQVNAGGGMVAEKALELLDNPSLDLAGKYLSREECHARAGLR